jgi:hypothetical protein
VTADDDEAPADQFVAARQNPNGRLAGHPTCENNFVARLDNGGRA